MDRSSGAGQATPGPSPRRRPVVRQAAEVMRGSALMEDLYARWSALLTAVRPIRFPLHRTEAIKPFFIVGSGRSGNTLVRRILAAAPGIHIPPETYVLGPVIAIFRRYQQLGWEQLVRLALAQFEFHPDFGDFGISLRPLVNQLVDLVPERRSLAAIIDAFYRYHGESSGIEVRRWGDKTPINAFSLDRIHRVFPDARYIHVVRDGADVTVSYVKAGLIDQLDDAARRWVASIDSIETFAATHPGISLEARYEELVADPPRSAAQIFDFLEIPFSPDLLDRLDHTSRLGDVGSYHFHAEVGRQITTAAVGRGRAELSPDDRLRLQSIMGSTLLAKGYPPLVEDRRSAG